MSTKIIERLPVSARRTNQRFGFGIRSGVVTGTVT
jgi:hypothetical protein